MKGGRERSSIRDGIGGIARTEMTTKSRANSSRDGILIGSNKNGSLTNIG